MEKVYIVRREVSLKGETDSAILGAYANLVDALDAYDGLKEDAKITADNRGFDLIEDYETGIEDDDMDPDTKASAHFEASIDGDWFFNHIIVELIELEVVM